MDPRFVQRPGVLNPLALVSFLVSVLNVVWVVVLGILALAIGTAGWLLGPVVGAVGTLVGALVALVLLLQSILSVLLFLAAWKTWNGEPGGRSLHLIWAWIIVVLDLIDLAFTGGIDPGAWARLIYAVIVIVVMNRPDIRDYFKGRHVVYNESIAKPSGVEDEWSY